MRRAIALSLVVRVLCIALLLPLLVASSAAAEGRSAASRTHDSDREEAQPARFHVGLEFFAGTPALSHTRVDELPVVGQGLDFSHDLGIGSITEGRLRFEWDINRGNRVAASVSRMYADGDATARSPVVYNGSTFSAGKLTSRPQWLIYDLHYQRTLSSWGADERGQLSLDIGLRYDRLLWRFEGVKILSGSEASEDFQRQSIPVPTLGLVVRQPLSEKLDLLAWGSGFRANHWNCMHNPEGGTVYLSESLVDAGSELAYRLTPRIELSLGYRFLYLDIAEKSHEDGNFITIRTHEAMLGLRLSF